MLNCGSSAIEMLSAPTLLENSESDRLPTFTWRPNAVRQFRFELGPERVRIDKEGNRDHNHNQHTNYDGYDFHKRFMMFTSCRNGEICGCRLKENLRSP